MKIAALFCLLVVAAIAADLKLKDGQVLKSFLITAESPTTVTIRHAGGLMKVAKSKLPAELLATYPIDEKAAAAEAAENAAGRAAYAAKVQAMAEREEKTRNVRDTAIEKKRARAAAREEALENARQDKLDALHKVGVNVDPAPDASVVEALHGRLLAAVRQRADDYFRSESGGENKLSIDLRYNLSKPRPISGWSNTFEVTGSGVHQYYESGKYSGFGQVRENFTARVEVKSDGTIEVVDFTAKKAR